MYYALKTSYSLLAFVVRFIYMVCMFTWLVVQALIEWLKGFAFVMSTFQRFAPPLGIILLGSLITELPFWALCIAALLPIGFVLPVFVVLFIAMLAI